MVSKNEVHGVRRMRSSGTMSIEDNAEDHDDAPGQQGGLRRLRRSTAAWLSILDGEDVEEQLAMRRSKKQQNEHCGRGGYI